MAYADFDLKQAVTRFRLLERVVPGMFAGVAPRSPSPRLTTWLDRYGPLAMGLGTERARSEYLITPILAEVEMQAEQPLQVLPGVSLDVDRSQGLTGVCDYLIARSEELFYVRAPLVAVVEAKREDLTSGLGQCVAEMVAVQIFNAREEADVEV
ncbi:MAG: hypothetical protein FJX77_11355, partial [Armatimonadetes bacterium]|nr:hypothetical protein [Armatimonadota bacterium]